ncbi:TrmH family RNA methyltransferase [Candidatus Daviesbacteria bacterium]|nr:TrmH family RNA methyltransferase [Candidatus Daviesbacteria bacterium]
MIKLNAKQLRGGPTSLKLRGLKSKVKHNEIYIVLDNVLDTYNIGSIFRLADAVSAKKIYLCGETATPPNHRIKKASINTTEWVEWEYCESAVEAISKITSEVKKMRLHLGGGGSIQIIAIEQSPKSIHYNKFEYKLPICLVVGHETNGVSKEVLEKVDGIVELPMFGINKSLNVMVSLGIVLYKVLEKKLDL